jgi:hypothetical protein
VCVFEVNAINVTSVCRMYSFQSSVAKTRVWPLEIVRTSQQTAGQKPKKVDTRSMHCNIICASHCNVNHCTVVCICRRTKVSHFMVLPI